MNDIFLKDTD